MPSLPPSPDVAAGAGDAGTPAHSLLRNAGWLLAERGARFLIVFSTGVLVTRHLGPADAGRLGSALALAAILAGLCDLGLDPVVRLHAIREPARCGSLLGTALALRLAAAPVAFAAFAFLLGRDQPDPTPPGLLVGLGLTLLAPATLVFDSWFQSQTQARFSVWGQTTALGFGAALRIIGLFTAAPLAWFGWAAGLETLAAGLALALLYRRHTPAAPRWQIDLATARRLLAGAWSLALTNLAILLYTRLDLVLLARLRDPAETGLYAAVVRLTELGYILPMILVNTLLPTLARLHASDPAGFLRTLQRLLALVAWTGVLTAAVLGVGSRTWVALLYGPAFAAAAPVLAVGAASCIFAGLGAVRAQWLLLHNLQHYGLYYVTLGALLNLSLNAWLIPRWGALGAALAGLATQAFIVFLAPLCFPATRPSVRLLLRAFLLDGVLVRTGAARP